MTFKKKFKSLFVQAKREEGNALFLILIAVALFAGLSYAVTQSGRSSGQSVSEESNLILSSQVVQYPAGIRTGITRMLIRGIGVGELLFNAPGSFSGTTSAEVFHPNGGGVAFQASIQDTVADSSTDLWVYDQATTVTDIATTASDVVALLPDVRDGVCQQVNESATGSNAIPVVTPAVAIADALSGGETIGGTGIDGQPFLCVEMSGGENLYYHVLVEQ